LNSQSVVVDLSGCTYLDSTCLNVLVRAKKALNDRLHVVVPQTAKIHRIFQVSGLEGPLNVVNSLDA
jgi:anti-anti-sigma factor